MSAPTFHMARDDDDTADPDDRPSSDAPADHLDDEEDRDELRQRYYGLVQELRILLPGVQVLVAFLFTVPFSSRFTELDEFGRTVFGVALWSGVVSIITLVTPAAFHRVGGRTVRSERLRWSIRLTRIGLLLFGVTLLGASFVVARFVFGAAVSGFVAATVVIAIGGLWVALPLAHRTHGRNDEDDLDRPREARAVSP